MGEAHREWVRWRRGRVVGDGREGVAGGGGVIGGVRGS
jgi:hypothetical protein